MLQVIKNVESCILCTHVHVDRYTEVVLTHMFKC